MFPVHAAFVLVDLNRTDKNRYWDVSIVSPGRLPYRPRKTRRVLNKKVTMLRCNKSQWGHRTTQMLG